MSNSRIHMIGIGGIGISALARLYRHDGKEVSGSDRQTTPITCGLEALGIAIVHEQKAENVPEDADLVVYSDAVKEDNPERLRAKELGIPQKQYFEALANEVNEYHLIAVAGTHGKTTTTAMLIDILEDADMDPTAVVGSLRAKTGSNFRPGKSKYCIVEADEYKEHFQYLRPDVLVITNIEFDHPDYFADLAAVQEGFRELARRVSEDGVIITAPKDANVTPALEGAQAKIVDYTEELDITMKLRHPGIYNRMNAAAAIATAAALGVPEDAAKATLAQFTGTWRRFEHKGEINSAPIYDDYAHHPSAIMAVIAGARDMYPKRRVVAVFQPHTYSRTAELFDDFAAALSKADMVILAPIYAAREENESGVSCEQLADALRNLGTAAESVSSLDVATTLVRESVGENDVVLVMGAGDITTVANDLAG